MSKLKSKFAPNCGSYPDVKILFQYGGAYVFGKERSAFHLMRELQHAGHQIFIVCNGWNNGHFIRLLRENNLQHSCIKLGKISKSIHPLHLKWTLDALLHLPAARIKFTALVRKHQPEVVVFESYYTYYLLRNTCRGLKTAVIYHEDPKNNFWLKQLLKPSANKATAHLGVSRFICRQLEWAGFPKNRIFLLYNTYDETPNYSPRRPHGNMGIRIGYAGQIQPWKGIEDLFDALALLKNRIHFYCLIAGTGDEQYTRFLKEKSRRLGIADSLYWLGYLERTEEFYRQIDLCVAPACREEAFGRTPMEAGLFGVPSIVTQSGGLPEIVQDGTTGFVVPIHAPAVIAQKIAYLFHRPETLAKMGRRARTDYRVRFSPKRQAARFIQIMHQLACPAF